MLTLCINFSFIRQKCLDALATFSEVPRCPFSFKIMKIALVPGLFEENPRQFPSCPTKVALPLPTFILRPAQGVEFWHAKMKICEYDYDIICYGPITITSRLSTRCKLVIVYNDCDRASNIQWDVFVALYSEIVPRKISLLRLSQYTNLGLSSSLMIIIIITCQDAPTF